MPVRIGILTAAHMHAWGYVHGMGAHPDSDIVGIWDDNAERGQKFASDAKIAYFSDIEELLSKVDAVCITSENNRHTELTVIAAQHGKHIICEKPLVTSEEDAKVMEDAVNKAGVQFMTAFPCRFSPAFQRLKQRVTAGEIGKIKALCTTNRGRCPYGWFIEKELSGGGAMIDHTVHVTDLLRDLLGAEPLTVQAQIGNNMYGQGWDDTAMVTIQFPDGVFASLDSSWSRPQSFKTWGDVTMTVVGEEGVIELDMFGQAVDHYHQGDLTHTLAGYGSNLDTLLIKAFIDACLNNSTPPVTLKDGLQAARLAIACYKSVGQPEPVAI